MDLSYLSLIYILISAHVLNLHYWIFCEVINGIIFKTLVYWIQLFHLRFKAYNPWYWKIAHENYFKNQIHKLLLMNYCIKIHCNKFCVSMILSAVNIFFLLNLHFIHGYFKALKLVVHINHHLSICVVLLVKDWFISLSKIISLVVSV